MYVKSTAPAVDRKFCHPKNHLPALNYFNYTRNRVSLSTDITIGMKSNREMFPCLRWKGSHMLTEVPFHRLEKLSYARNVYWKGFICWRVPTCLKGSSHTLEKFLHDEKVPIRRKGFHMLESSHKMTRLVRLPYAGKVLICWKNSQT